METSCKQGQDIQNKVIRELDRLPDIQRSYWTEFEIEVLKKYYGKKDPGGIAKVLNRTRSAVMRKASDMGLSFSKEA